MQVRLLVRVFGLCLKFGVVVLSWGRRFNVFVISGLDRRSLWVVNGGFFLVLSDR